MSEKGIFLERKGMREEFLFLRKLGAAHKDHSFRETRLFAWLRGFEQFRPHGQGQGMDATSLMPRKRT